MMKVAVSPLQPHSLAFGGFEIQMISALEAAKESGVDIFKLNPWSREDNYDIFHIWGCSISHLDAAQWAHKRGKKLVISALFPYPSLKTHFRYIASLVFGTSWQRSFLLNKAEGITVLNDLQAQYLINILKFPVEKVHIIPNIIDEIFFNTSITDQNSQIHIDNYVICVGNIRRLKNQLRLAEACNKVGVPLLLVGDVLPGEEDYGNDLAEFIRNSKNIQWIKGLPSNSIELAFAYNKSAAFALPSFGEVQPISALEAAAQRKPLLFGDRAYARQSILRDSAVCDPKSVDSIVAGIKAILDRPDNFQIDFGELELCRKSYVGKAYYDLYGNL